MAELGDGVVGSTAAVESNAQRVWHARARRSSLLMSAARVLAITLRYFLGRRSRPYTLVGIAAVHARTNGRADRLLSRIVTLIERRLDRNSPVRSREGDAVSGEPIEPLIAGLQKDGIVTLQARLDPGDCAELMALATRAEADVVQDEGPTGRGVYDSRSRKEAAHYKFSAETLLTSDVVQRLVTDPFLLRLAQSYFGSVPVLSYVTMWWSTCRDSPGGSYLAQRFHFDDNGLQWLKIFVYLTDVDADSGPHSYIKGTHAPGSDAGSLLKRGAIRLSDEEVIGSFPPDRLLEALGPTGTIVVADTWGLHKGKAPSGRDRLVLQLVFNNSLLGVNSPLIPVILPTEQLVTSCTTNPRTYAMLTVVGQT